MSSQKTLKESIKAIQTAYILNLAELRKNKAWQLNSEIGSQKDTCYVMYDKRSKLYKIGITNSLIARWNSIGHNTGTTPRLVIAVLLECGFDESANDLESFLHRYFKPKRQRGEWFELSPLDVICIRRLFWEKVEGESIIDNIPNHLAINPTLQIQFA